MDSNYEWQRQQARHRVNSRRHEAELARQAKAADSGAVRPSLLSRLFARLPGRPRGEQPEQGKQPAVAD